MTDERDARREDAPADRDADDDQGVGDPARDEALRALLRGAGGPLPTPPAVVARLEDTLAGLVAARADGEELEPAAPAGEPPTGAPGSDSAVTSLSSRRRRWPAALLAAAAVVVGGYAIGGAVTGTLSGGADSSVAGTAESADDTGGGQIDGDALGAGAESAGSRAALPASRRELEAEAFEQEVREIARSIPKVLALDGGAAAPTASPEPRARARSRCSAPPSTPRDVWFEVTYDGERATLVLSPVRAGEVTARVFDCDSVTLLRSARVAVQ